MIEIWAIVCLIVSLTLFVLPFQRKKPNMADPPRDPLTLSGVARGLLRGMRGDKPKRALLRVGGLLLLLTLFFPPLMLIEAREVSQSNAVQLRLALAGQGILMIAGAAFTVLIQVFSNLLIGFGASRTATNTFIAPIIPLYQAGFGIAGFLLSIWHY